MAVKCQNCGSSVSYLLRCPKCRLVGCYKCITGTFSLKCPNCKAKVDRSKDKVKV